MLLDAGCDLPRHSKRSNEAPSYRTTEDGGAFAISGQLLSD
jgi:hypothetical protein